MPSCLVSPARAPFFSATLPTQLTAVLATAAFPNTTNCITKKRGINWSSSLPDTHFTLVHHPDENIYDLKKRAKPIWRWISSLRNIFYASLGFKNCGVAWHLLTSRAYHSSQYVGNWVTWFIFTGDLFLHLLKVYDWEGRTWYLAPCE